MSAIDLTIAERATELGSGFAVEGGLIGADLVALIARGGASEQAPADYGVPKGLVPFDEIERAFRIARAAHAEPVADPARQARALLAAFDHDDLRPGPLRLGEQAFPVDLVSGDGRVLVVAAPLAEPGATTLSAARHEAGEGGRYRSPAMLLQDALNASDAALWGLVTDGRRVRLMRDSVRLGRPAHLEADLAAVLEAEDLSAFAGLWRLIHRSRFGRGEVGGEVGGEGIAADCPLERWSEQSLKRGVAARERLRDGVEEALKALGRGLLADPELRARAIADEIKAQALHTECLRLVYRIIFVLTAEDRGVLHAPNATDEAREAYRDGYSLARLAVRSRRRTNWDRHSDAFEAVKIVFRALERGEALLGLPALGGLFRRELTPILNTARLSSRAFMEALFRLAWLVDKDTGAIARVNWRDMQTEELGSVYESLLELVPQLAEGGTALLYAGGAEAKGNERKVTGSYYTPDSLVQALLDSALDPVIADRRRGIGTPNGERGAEGILTMTVCDPACGSGHFLLAAARRLAEAVARERADETGEAYGPDGYRAALREVVRRSIHGVDRNDFAVELAKVALWIETVEPGKPLGFLDANVRHGDSLLGLSDLSVLAEGIPDAAYKALTGDEKEIAKELRKRNKAERNGQGALDFAAGGGALPDSVLRLDRTVHESGQDTLEEVERLRAAFEARLDDMDRQRVRLAADAWVAAFLLPKVPARTPGRTNPEVPTTADIGRILSGRNDPRLDAVIDEAAHGAHAFHWPLAFPLVHARGGFDAMVGNPPWERIKLQEQEFFAARAPEIAEAPNAAARGRMITALAKADEGTAERALHDEFERAKRTAEAASEFARTGAVDGKDGPVVGRFPLTGRGDVNTYALFAELFARGVNERGRAGCMVPMSIATDDTTKFFFGDLVTQRKLVRLFSFHEIRKWFPGTDDSRAFCILTTGSNWDAGAEFLFGATSVSDWLDARRRFALPPETIAAINPNTRTAPVFRSRRDAALTAKIYGRVPVLWDETRADGNPWGVSFMAMFHMSNDSGLFRTAAQLEAEGWRREGTDWVRGISLAGGRSSAAGSTDASGVTQGIPDGRPTDQSAAPSPTPGTTTGASSLLGSTSDNIGGSSPYAVTTPRQGAEPPTPLAGECLRPAQGGLDLAGGTDGRSLALDADPFDVNEGVTGQRYVPLYEAKMMHQFDHRWATYEGGSTRDATPTEKADPEFEPTPRYWVPKEEVDARLQAKGWGRAWLMGWRDITKTWNERTVLSGAFPNMGVNDKYLLYLLNNAPRLAAAFLASINSITHDFVARQKIGGTSLKYFTFKQLPILPPAAYSPAALDHVVPCVLELTYTSHAMAPFARDLGHHGDPFPWDEERRALLRAELDGWFAHAYGLTRDELRYVLDPADVEGPDYPSETFRVLKKNEIRDHGEYRTQRLVLAAFDALAEARAADPEHAGLAHVDRTLDASGKGAGQGAGDTPSAEAAE